MLPAAVDQADVRARIAACRGADGSWRALDPAVRIVRRATSCGPRATSMCWSNSTARHGSVRSWRPGACSSRRSDGRVDLVTPAALKPLLATQIARRACRCHVTPGCGWPTSLRPVSAFGPMWRIVTSMGSWRTHGPPMPSCAISRSSVEAVKKLPPELLAQAPHVPWSDVAGFRDILAHAYFRVDLTLVWDIVQHELPALEEAARQLGAIDDES